MKQPCQGCGQGEYDERETPIPSRCQQCPKRPCKDCGEADDRYCSCWIELDGLPLADIKGLLARGDLSVGGTA